MYQIILKFFFRGLCDCPPQSLYTCGRCDEVLPPDQLGKALNVLHESCRNNNVRVHVWSRTCLILLVRSGSVRSGPEGPQFGRSDRTLIWRRLATGWAGKGPYLMCSVIPVETAYRFDPPLLSLFGFFDSFLTVFEGRNDDVLPPDELGKALNVLSDACRNNHVWSPPYSRPFYFYSCLFTY